VLSLLSYKKLVLAVLRGNLLLSESIMQRFINEVWLATEKEIEAVGAVSGCPSAVGLTSALIIVDDAIPGRIE
jgi:hypothetical protein